MRRILLLNCLLVSLAVYSQEINIIPSPAVLHPGKGIFTITRSTSIVVKDDGDRASAGFLNSYLKRFYGFQLPVKNTDTKNSISIYTRKFITAPGKDAYTFTSSATGVVIDGDTYAGSFYGIQTLIQLLPLPNPKSKIPNQKLTIQQLTITDYPRFSYRGLHLDCGRHFMPVDFIKKYIDYMALHKLNYFHWHLTEDQGWRIEIKKYPRLTSVGAWRNGTIIGRHPGMGNDHKKYGGFYTQQQVKEIVKYAAGRHITVVPEIEMPGHSSAAIAAYPSLSCFPEEPTKNYFPKNGKWAGDSTGKKVQQAWGIYSDVFCAGKEETFKFLQDVIDEILPLFPGKYIHIGGDECPKANWKRCPNCQQRIKDNNLKDEHELQSYFIQRMEKNINSKGKTLIGWDEILEGGLAPNAVVMSWRGEKGGIDAAKEKHEVIMTPTSHVYFDYSQTENEDSLVIGGYLPVEKVYSYEPIPAELNPEQAKYVLGAQANVWTEYMNNPRKVEYMLFPRLTALSEVLWSPKENRDWSDFEKRLQAQFKRYDLWKVNYSTAFYSLRASVLPSDDPNALIWKLQSKYSRKNCEYCYIRTEKEFIYQNDTVQNDTIAVYDIKDPTRIVSFKIESKKINKGAKGISVNSAYLEDTVAIVKITESTTARAEQRFHHTKGPVIEQKFHFNKATGKKITLIIPPASAYRGDGAFTLVNGVWNEKGLAKAKEFLGFSGSDCEAVIDLGKEENFSSVIVHAYRNEASWIWRPLTVEVFLSANGKNFSSIGLTDDFTETKSGNGILKVEFITASPVRFVKVVVKNRGEIPAGKPGEGNKAWLFIDEIEIKPPTP
jgi:hexosaminidase